MQVALVIVNAQLLYARPDKGHVASCGAASEALRLGLHTWQSGVEAQRDCTVRPYNTTCKSNRKFRRCTHDPCGKTACALESCACVQLKLCTEGSSCQNLTEILRPAKRATLGAMQCVRHEDCNTPHGQCMTDGRCACFNVENGTMRWGGPSCSIDNLATLAEASNPQYDESIFKLSFGWSALSNSSWMALKRAGAQSTSPDGKPMRDRAADFSLSGPGSSAQATVGLRVVLPPLVRLLDIQTIADVPCGDFNYMKEVLYNLRDRPQLRYLGGDIVKDLVHDLQAAYSVPGRTDFVPFDLSLQTLPPVDLVLLRDLLFHFDAMRGHDILERVNASGARYFMSTHFPHTDNEETERHFHAGSGFGSFWPLNLEQKPFLLPHPLIVIGANGELRPQQNLPVMGLWALPLWS
mmetsp:Transcript_46150/g.76291  ORF Transcript_46150/g.76291 Transcript_46150/m.76291 type:complete len:409 (-) Transcript_46150:292-1518(-)